MLEEYPDETRMISYAISVQKNQMHYYVFIHCLHYRMKVKSLSTKVFVFFIKHPLALKGTHLAIVIKILVLGGKNKTR